MGENSEWIEASGGGSETQCLDICEAQDVPICSQENCGGAAEKVGEDQGEAEEGGVAVLVTSPAVFQVQCKTPRQIELANGFCRYLEMARPV
jgi:hypothetical protein